MDDSEPREQRRPEGNGREELYMWIFAVAVVLLIAGGMGANMLFHKEQPATSDDTEISAQSRTAPAQ